MQATTYRREIFARPGDNLFLFTHKAGHVFEEAPRERRNARGPRTVWNGSRYEVVKAAERHVGAKRTGVKRVSSVVMWLDCPCGMQYREGTGCRHGRKYIGADNGKGGNGGL